MSVETAAWLPQTSTPDRLIRDLKHKGWRLWWRADGALQLTAPDRHQIITAANTTAQTICNAYASAQEYSNGLTVDAINSGEEA